MSFSQGVMEAYAEAKPRHAVEDIVSLRAEDCVYRSAAFGGSVVGRDTRSAGSSRPPQ